MIGIGVPLALRPIRRLKNGTRFSLLELNRPCALPNVKMPEFSRKKSRFSGKNRLKRVRLTCC
jgi:hypothetical protein